MKAKVRKNINKYNAIKMTCKINQGMHLRGLFSCNADIKRALKSQIQNDNSNYEDGNPNQKSVFLSFRCQENTMQNEKHGRTNNFEYGDNKRSSFNGAAQCPFWRHLRSIFQSSEIGNNLFSLHKVKFCCNVLGYYNGWTNLIILIYRM